ncbi:MAG: mannitol dehydrogenase family protein [Miniphocaeibacter sp.]|uniref:mannitol dehydrogenase family protein n=1 Tax=Miniphocaeibacter sp. TaxID=3100973 RepID=UPI0018223EB2|nr:mannitol dehydrogenase family protein [Gallicola sp.]
MKLNLELLEKKQELEKINIKIPNYDVKKLQENTEENCKWLHFGAGNIFRAYLGKIQQDLIEKGLENTGIIAVDTLNSETIERVYKPYNNLTISVVLSKDGIFSKEIIGSITKAIDYSNNLEYDILKKIFKNELLQIVTFTVTEKGYNLYGTSGEFLPIVKKDINNDPVESKHLISKITRLLYERYKSNKLPLTLISMDNCSNNGDLLKNSIITIAKKWIENNFLEEEFIDYIKNDKLISFPITMIDKITPRPSEIIATELMNDGFEDIRPIITTDGTHIAPFVNSEKAGYLVIEDAFTNGRPSFEEVGIYVTTRENVDKSEKMKVTACLNPLHTTLAVYGCLLGYSLIADEMNDRELVKLIKKIGYEESLPVVNAPSILEPKEFINEVLEERLPNRFLPDSPQRIATDTSQKVGIRFGETIKSYLENEDLNVTDLQFIPLAIAGWLRYLLSVDDKGETFELSPDPLLDELTKYLVGISLEEFKPDYSELNKLLSNEKIFGVDLVEIGLSDKVINYLKELSSSIGAVRRTLEKYLL